MEPKECTATADCPYEGLAPMGAEDMAKMAKDLTPAQVSAVESFISGMKTQEAMQEQTA